MAGKIQLTPAELLAQSAEMLALEQEFASLFQKTESLLGQVNSDWSANLANNFAGKITSAQKACTSIINMLDGGAKIAETSANTMDSVDQLLKKAISGDGVDAEATPKRVTDWFGTEKEEREGWFDGFGANNAYIYKDEGENGAYYWGKASASAGWGGGLTLGGKKKWKKDPLWNDVTYKGNGKAGKVPDYYGKKFTLLEGQIGGAQASASLFEYGYSDGKTSVSGSFLKAEVHADAYAGLYVYGDDGTKFFSPGIRAEIGGSVTGAEFNWDQQWVGDERLGINSHFGTTIGKAEAKAEGAIVFRDEKGKINPQINVNGSAEALAWEMEGSVGVNVLGGEIGVKGSVNLGIGAHADFGYKDGVIKCDIGASLGIGASVAFEVDVGGMVDTAIEHAEDIGKAFESGAKAVGDFAEDVGDAIADGAEAAWDGFKGLFGF